MAGKDGTEHQGVARSDTSNDLDRRLINGDTARPPGILDASARAGGGTSGAGSGRAERARRGSGDACRADGRVALGRPASANRRRPLEPRAEAHRVPSGQRPAPRITRGHRQTPPPRRPPAPDRPGSVILAVSLSSQGTTSTWASKGIGPETPLPAVPRELCLSVCPDNVVDQLGETVSFAEMACTRNDVHLGREPGGDLPQLFLRDVGVAVTVKDSHGFGVGADAGPVPGLADPPGATDGLEAKNRCSRARRGPAHAHGGSRRSA